MMEPLSNSSDNFKIKREIFRKLLHLPGLALPFLFAQWPNLSLIILVFLTLLFVISEMGRTRGKSKIPLMGYITQKLARSSRFESAPIFLAIGMGGSCYFFPWRDALVGAWLVCVCDGAAAILGMKYGRKKIAGTKKTYWGSLFFFLTGIIGLLPLTGWGTGIFISLIGMLVELVSFKGRDNLFLPIAGTILAFFL